jgi:uncharacterized protein YndB with AHSA1/START domain
MAPVNRKVNLSIPIQSPPDRIFAMITDLPNYNNWLPHSDVFKGTTQVSETPVRTGTRYEEHSPSGTRFGEVQLLDTQNRHVVFHQPMKLKPFVLGLGLDVTVDMTVKNDENGGCVLDREVRLGIPTVMGLLSGVVLKQFKDESWRTMEQLKAFAESTKE